MGATDRERTPARHEPMAMSQPQRVAGPGSVNSGDGDTARNAACHQWLSGFKAHE